jgi:hypothetical protein
MSKIAGTSEFYKNTPKLFHNYNLVPVMLRVLVFHPL